MAIAASLWAVLFARLFTSVLYVRERLLLEKGKPFDRAPAVLAHTSALLICAALAWFRLVPALVVIPFAVLLYRCVIGLSSSRTPMKAMQIGVREVIYGAVVAAAIIVGTFAGI